MKKNYRFVRRMLCGVLSVAMLSMTACNKEASQKQNVGNDTVDEVRDYVYVPEYLDFVKSDEDSWFGNMQILDDTIYFESSSWDESTQQSSDRILRYHLTDKTTEVVLEQEEELSTHSFVVDQAQNIYMVAIRPDYDEESETDDAAYFLKKYSADGEEIYNEEITDILRIDEYAYVQNIAIDGQGRVYIDEDDIIFLFDEQGQYAGEVKTSGDWIVSMSTGGDGKVYISYGDYSDDSYETVLAEIDYDGKKIAKTYKNLPGADRLCPKNDTTFLSGDGSALYQYDIQAEESELVLKWLDSDINGDYVTFISALDDDHILAVLNDWNTNDTELVRLTKTKASEVTRKTEITIATLYQNQNLQAAAVNFNKNNNDYRIRIKTYLDLNDWSETSYTDAITRMTNDLTSDGNAPDIIDLSSVDEVKLVGKNVLEDLTPYLQKSTKLSEDAFVDGILDKFKVDGVLTGIPRTVSITTFVGKTSVVGDKHGWTLEDMIQVADAHPDSDIFNGVTQTDMLNFLLLLNENYFIDWESGKCNFDSEDFIKVLEFVNRFPEDFDWDNYDDSSSRFQQNQVLLDAAYIDDFYQVQSYEAKFGEPINFIGFPTMEGNFGHALITDGRCGIVSSSDNKDAAWEFIEYYLTDDSSMFEWGLNILKDKFDKQVEEATRVEYVYDEDGEIMLDENGDPIIEDDRVMYSDDLDYNYRTPNEEDVDLVLGLLKDARSISEGFDQAIIDIISEEAGAYFHGQKSAEDVASIIQNRLQNYVSENM